VGASRGHGARSEGSTPSRKDTSRPGFASRSGSTSVPCVKIHLVDGTYELFRAHFAWPSSKGSAGQEVAAAKGLFSTLRRLLATPGVTHVACAFDHVIESFRNDLFPGYKTGEGLDPSLLGQFDLAERVCVALGVVTWPMVEFEADDALATAARRWCDAPGVEQVVICSPDKDLTQCVRGDRVVCWDRMRDRVYAEPDVIEKFGVPPASIPDYLALVGDTADGIPGVPRWGKKAAAVLLAEYGHLEAIPHDDALWRVKIRGSRALAAELALQHSAALLYRELATLRFDVPLAESLDDLRYRGPDLIRLRAICEEVADFSLLEGVVPLPAS
jgi:5'-3' exonuclease